MFLHFVFFFQAFKVVSSSCHFKFSINLLKVFAFKVLCLFVRVVKGFVESFYIQGVLFVYPSCWQLPLQQSWFLKGSSWLTNFFYDCTYTFWLKGWGLNDICIFWLINLTLSQVEKKMITLVKMIDDFLVKWNI